MRNHLSDFPFLTSKEGTPAYGVADTPFGAGEVRFERFYCGCALHNIALSGRTFMCRIGMHAYQGEVHTPGVGFAALGAAWWHVCTRCGKVR